MMFSDQVCTVLIGQLLLTNQQCAPASRPFMTFRFLSDMSGELSHQGVENTPY